MRTPGSTTRRACTRSPMASKLWPSTSKPTATLPTLAGANAVASVLMRRLASQLGTEIGAHAQQVTKDPAGSHFGPGTGPLHDQGIGVVAAGQEAHHIIGEIGIGERVRALQLHQAHRGLAARSVDRSHIT